MKRDALPLTPPLIGAEHLIAPAWRVALPALALALVFIGARYAETGAEIVSTWYRSATFAHGFVVAPISLWLVWRRREQLRAIEPRPWFVVLPLMVVAGMAWLVGEFAAVNAVSQAAFVAMLVFAVPAVLGRDVARAIMFPLGFLFFAVPIGDFLLPTLRDRTADFTVWALRVTGIPVYREGWLIVVPNGRWSIVEACSGVRYLIASLMTGTLFGYLNYRANWRRWVFVGVSIVVPIIANWIRAYLIVLLGYLSNNRLAAGVDHLIYGWLFFGLVMLLMFWIGSRWSEPRESPSTMIEAPPPAALHAAPAARFWLAVVAVMAVTLVWPLVDAATQVPDRDSSPVVTVAAIPGWHLASDQSGFTPRFVAPSASVHQAWQRGSASAGLHIAYYRQQNQERKVVSSENVLVSGEDRAWVRTKRQAREVSLGGAKYRIVETRMHAPDLHAYVAWQWYWIDGAVTSSDALAKARIGWSRLIHRTDDSAAIVIYAEDGNGQPAVDTLQQFARDAWPAIAAALQRAEAGR